MREIKATNKIAPDITTIIIASEEVNLNSFDLTDAEKNYILDALHKKIFTIPVNKYGYWYIFQFPEEKSSVYALNEALRNAAHRIHKLLAKEKITNIQVLDAGHDAGATYALLEGLMLSDYQFLKYFNNKTEKVFRINSITLVSERLVQKDADEISHIAEAVYTARDMINEPASFLTATQLANEIEELGKKSGFKTEVFDKAQIEAHKMGGILAVNKGSSEPPTFTVMTWKPENAVNEKPYVLIGKGIVYDSGGLSLKPTPDSMDYMKSDMAGAAAVAGTMYALASSQIPVYVIALAPSTDNRLDALSYSPGDVITMHNGTTVEVLNTDAEGRLVLADALSYATRFDPELVITIATLTGSAHRAIGELGMAGMGNAANSVFNQLEETGWQVYERIARLPFWEEYAEMIKSDIADLKNIGSDVAGAITAGKFLEHFTPNPFIHLDIAGVAFSKKGKSYKGKGASAAGVRLLYHFLKNQVQNKL
jgi:leucyl aminopeptidase